MKIQRWTGTELVDVLERDLPVYARGGLYIPCGNGDCRHLWVFANPKEKEIVSNFVDPPGATVGDSVSVFPR